MSDVLQIGSRQVGPGKPCFVVAEVAQAHDGSLGNALAYVDAAADAGADAVSLVNTFLAMSIDVETRRPRLSNIVGGLSGPAIRPIAVRMVYECRQRIRIPIIGMGGIANATDALEFIIAGASAVQVGTANFADPLIWPKLLDGIRSYGARHGVTRLADLVGSIDTRAREKEWISS